MRDQIAINTSCNITPTQTNVSIRLPRMPNIHKTLHFQNKISIKWRTSFVELHHLTSHYQIFTGVHHTRSRRANLSCSWAEHCCSNLKHNSGHTRWMHNLSTKKNYGWYNTPYNRTPTQINTPTRSLRMSNIHNPKFPIQHMSQVQDILHNTSTYDITLPNFSSVQHMQPKRVNLSPALATTPLLCTNWDILVSRQSEVHNWLGFLQLSAERVVI